MHPTTYQYLTTGDLIYSFYHLILIIVYFELNDDDDKEGDMNV